MQIYVTDKTNVLLEKAADADNRSKDGEIKHLCEQRLKELSLLDVDPSSGDVSDNSVQVIKSQQ